MNCGSTNFEFEFEFGRLPKLGSRPNNIGGKMSVRPYVHKKFLRFE